MGKHKDVLGLALGLLKRVGQHPKHNGKKEKILTASYMLLLVVISALVFMQFFFINGSVQKLAESFEASMTFLQLGLKLASILIYKNDLAQLLDEIKMNFWDIKSHGPDVEKMVSKASSGYYQWLRIFLVTSISTIIMMSAKALLSDGEELPVACWLPEGNTAIYYLMFVLENVLLYFVLFMVVGFDGLFGALCTQIVMQFRLLYYEMSLLRLDEIKNKAGERICDEKFAKIIRHHVYLLRYTKQMIKVYSLFFIGQYFITVCSACMELYIISESSDNISMMTKSGVYISSLLVQIGNFCWPATNVTTESNMIVDGIYKSGWECYPKKRHEIGLIMSRSQRDVIFTAGNMLNVNRQSYIFVMKTSFSFYTLMRAMKERRV